MVRDSIPSIGTIQDTVSERERYSMVPGVPNSLVRYGIPWSHLKFSKPVLEPILTDWQYELIEPISYRTSMNQHKNKQTNKPKRKIERGKEEEKKRKEKEEGGGSGDAGDGHRRAMGATAAPCGPREKIKER